MEHKENFKFEFISKGNNETSTIPVNEASSADFTVII